ncbi:spore germination protein PF [Peribacillus deserti]|uniref:Spore germination protein PF n=1 Tax=Peribacillus deserti TaxID=673318 RepID=A0ABS2QLW9_9BACI|nr:spore germination protein [Peribacillus deserti]MBM7694005.1 spore germination protein PF [Peribacillus deserti]
MPSFVGPVQITSVDSGGIAHFGDAVVISPKEATKSVSGSGGGNTGLLILTNNLANGNLVNDANLVDQPILGNG